MRVQSNSWRREGGKVSVAVKESSIQAVVHVRVWHWAKMVGVQGIVVCWLC